MFSFDSENEAAQREAKRAAARMVTRVSAETKQALRAMIARSIEDGIAPHDAARLIRSMIGLTTPQALSAMNYRAEMLAAGLAPAKVEAALKRYIGKKIRERAATITRTEIMGALNRGASASFRRAQKAGFLGPNAKKEWIVTGDERLCPVCGPMDGARVPLNQAFSVGGPPAHPRCRCTIGLAP